MRDISRKRERVQVITNDRARSFVRPPARTRRINLLRGAAAFAQFSANRDESDVNATAPRRRRKLTLLEVIGRGASTVESVRISGARSHFAPSPKPAPRSILTGLYPVDLIDAFMFVTPLRNGRVTRDSITTATKQTRRHASRLISACAFRRQRGAFEFIEHNDIFAACA